MIQIVTFLHEGARKTGLLHQGEIYASPRYASMLDVLDDWEAADARLAGLGDAPPPREPVQGAVLAAPLAPRAIYFAGANYRDHVEEMQRELAMPLEVDPKGKGLKPWHAIKAAGPTVVGPDAQVPWPGAAALLDWELELGAVIGKTARGVSAKTALAHVAGYVVANDLSARGHFARDGVDTSSPFKWDWIGQKSFDGSCPLGPAITPARFIGDPMNLDMKLWVNGELMQDSNTSRMLFDIAEQIEHLSTCLTLQPGDLILTGTPAGVGAARRRFLAPGDVVRQWIEGIGEFTFSIAPPAA